MFSVDKGSHIATSLDQDKDNPNPFNRSKTATEKQSQRERERGRERLKGRTGEKYETLYLRPTYQLPNTCLCINE